MGAGRGSLRFTPGPGPGLREHGMRCAMSTPVHRVLAGRWTCPSSRLRRYAPAAPSPGVGPPPHLCFPLPPSPPPASILVLPARRWCCKAPRTCPAYPPPPPSAPRVDDPRPQPPRRPLPRPPQRPLGAQPHQPRRRQDLLPTHSLSLRTSHLPVPHLLPRLLLSAPLRRRQRADRQRPAANSALLHDGDVLVFAPQSGQHSEVVYTFHSSHDSILPTLSPCANAPTPPPPLSSSTPPPVKSLPAPPSYTSLPPLSRVFN